MLEGIHTALITPLKSGNVDVEALHRLVDRQTAAGVQGIVVCGSTGEGSTLTAEERRAAIGAVVRRAGNRVVVTAGTGAIATAATIELTREAAELGAQYALVVSPAYVKPSQDGIASHYEAVAEASPIPIIAYNVPGRTGSDVLPSTVARISKHPRIAGLKEASGSIVRIQQVLAACEKRLAVLAGDDPLTVSTLVAGGHGVICTASNVAPELWVSLWRSWKEGRIALAAQIQAKLFGLHEALFLEANPGPAKAALHMLGLIEPEIRAPLTWPTPSTCERLSAELVALSLLKASGQ